MRQLCGRLLQSSCVLLVTVCGLWLGVQHGLHLELLAVQTGSMAPTFLPGDAVVVQAGSNPTLGEVVAYHSPKNPRLIVSHRLVGVMPGQGLLQTKGDALAAADPPVRRSLLIGRVVAVLPQLGIVLGWLRSWTALTACLYIPAVVLVATELRRLERHFRRNRTYYLHA